MVTGWYTTARVIVNSPAYWYCGARTVLYSLFNPSSVLFLAFFSLLRGHELDLREVIHIPDTY